MTVKKFRQPEVKKKEFDFSQAMDLFKDKRSYRVCEQVISRMDRFQRAGVLIEMLLNSKYRAFNQTIIKFKTMIEDYKVGLVEKEQLIHYKNNLQVGTSERLLDQLTDIRERIILDLINYNTPVIIEALHYVIDVDGQYFYGSILMDDKELEHPMDKLYKPAAVELCQIMWPDQAKGLKVLFGDKE